MGDLRVPIPSAAIAINVSQRTIRRWIAAGMPSDLVNNQHLIDLDDLHAWALRYSRQCHSIRDRRAQ